MAVSNTLAYYNSATIMAAKGFIVQALGSLTCRSLPFERCHATGSTMVGSKLPAANVMKHFTSIIYEWS
jgi:hypothetical protein